MDPQALYNFTVNMINDYFNGNNLSNEKIKDIDNKLHQYFIEYKKKYDEDPAKSWLAKVLDEDQFFNYGNYTNVNEFLGDIKEERGL
jgi:hypothetical protein